MIPSEKTLRERLGLDADKAREVRAAMKYAGTDERRADSALARVDKVLDGYGVETIRAPGSHVSQFWQDTALLYVNKGDAYSLTVCYDTARARFLVSSWGDIVEREPRRFGGEQ